MSQWELRHRSSQRAAEVNSSRLHVALVSSADGIRLAVVERSAEAMLARLADYVREETPNVLWPKDAERVSALLSAGELEAAISYYFERVGNRWDQEFLHRETVSC